MLQLCLMGFWLLLHWLSLTHSSLLSLPAGSSRNAQDVTLLGSFSRKTLLGTFSTNEKWKLEDKDGCLPSLQGSKQDLALLHSVLTPSLIYY